MAQRILANGSGGGVQAAHAGPSPVGAPAATPSTASTPAEAAVTSAAAELASIPDAPRSALQPTGWSPTAWRLAPRGGA